MQVYIDNLKVILQHVVSSTTVLTTVNLKTKH